MQINRAVSVVGAISCFIAILSFTCDSSAAALGGSVNESRIGAHFKVIPAANGINEITLVANGLNYQDTNGNWIESIPIVQSFSSAVLCTGASYRVILATNLNSYGSVDMELPADSTNGVRGRMVSHPLGIAFYDPDSGASVLLAELKDCSAQIMSNKVIFADAFAGSNGIEGSVTYTYDVGHFDQDVTLTAKPSVTPADFGMGANARLEMLTEIVQSPTPVIKERTLSPATRSTTSAMTAQPATEPAVTDQTLNYGTMQMGMGQAFSTAAPTASPQDALPVAKRLVSIESRTFLTEDVPWNKAAEVLQSLPQSSTGVSATPQASAKRALPRQKMLAQSSAPSSRPGGKLSFNERLAEVHRSQPLKLAWNHRSPSGFVMDYTTVPTCDDFTFQTGQTYFINSSVEIGYGTIESSAVIKLSASGNLGILLAINCPDDAPKAVITDMNDDSVGETIPGSIGHVPGSRAYVGLDLSQLDDYPGYVHNLDIRFFGTGILAPLLGNPNDWCYVYDCWFFECGLGAYGTDSSLSVFTSDFCNVGTLYYPSDIYASDNTTCTADRNGNGLPDTWEMTYFASLAHSASELDATGNTLLYDYENNLDPNIIRFTVRLGNQYFKTTNATGTFSVLAGVPGSMAVLVNNTNFSAAVWASYNGSASFPLGTTDGVYQVWLGLKGFAGTSTPVWMGTEVYLDRVAPVLAITSPITNSTVSVPWLQVQGYSPEVLQSVTYDLSNAVTLVTNQPGYGTSSFLDTNTLTFTTNWFQCYDIFLTNGLNRITVHGADMAGNVTTTNINVNLSYASASNPVIQVTWPQNGMKLCQNSFDLRGWTEDAAATVFATITDTNGNTNTINGVVERTGVLWVEGLPLADGTNYLTLVVTNTAGLVSSTNLFLVKSAMTLALTSITGDLWNPTVSVSGNVSDTTATIYVNGVPGVNHADGTWSADNVPVSPSGMASFDLKAVPVGGGDPDAGTNIEKEAEITLDGAKWSDERLDQLHPDSGDYYSSEKETWDWTSAGGGTLKELWQWNYLGNHGDASFPIATGGDLTGGHLDSWWWGDSETYDILADDLDEWITPVDSQWWISTTHGAVGQGGYNDWKNLGQEQGSLNAPDSTPLETWSEKRTEQPTWTLHTGGKKMPDGQSLFSVASQTLEELAVKGKIVDGVDVPNTQPTINGKAQGTDGILWTTLPDGADVKLTFQTGVPLARISPSVQKYHLLIQVNGGSLPHQIDPSALSHCVGENLTFAPLWFPSLTYDDAVAHWSLPDKFVNERPYSYCDGYYDEDPSLLNRILSVNHTLSTSVWYVKELQSGTAKLSMNLSFPNGQTVYVQASGQLKVYRPTYSGLNLSSPAPKVGLSLNKMGLTPPAGIGIGYWVVVSSQLPGAARYVQLFNGMTINTSPIVDTGGQDWLDTSAPYPFGDTKHTFQDVAVEALTDQPWDLCESSPSISNNNYTDYLQFMPDAGPGPNIYVTLCRITWSVNAKANLTPPDGVWILDPSSSVVGPSGPSDSGAFPLWAHTYP